MRLRKKAALIAAGALLAFQAIAIVGATSASAVGSCTFNLLNHTLTVTINSGSSSTLDVQSPSGAIRLDGTACGSATIANTTAISVLGQPGASETLTIDNATGLAFPGSISWAVDLDSGAGDSLGFDLASGQDNTLSMTDSGFSMNGGSGVWLGVEQLTVTGGDGNDTIDGSALSASGPTLAVYGDPLFVTPGGMDVISGGAGNDFLSGEDGNDTISGGAGNDTIYGSAWTVPVDDDDVLSGGAGNDTIYATQGDDVVTGGAGADSLDGGTGDDTFDEGAAASGADTIDGAGGTDTVDYGDRTTDTIVNMDTGLFDSGEDANGDGDALDTGDEGDQLLNLEVAVTGAGDDTLVGDGTPETFVPGDGDDSVDGNGGTDTLDYSTSSAAMMVDVAAGTASGQGNDMIADVEDFVGSHFGDAFVDDQSTNNGYDGGAGDDWFDQGAANGTDADDIAGGDGVDTVDYSARTEDVSVYLDCHPFWSGGTSENDTICDVENALTGSGDDTVQGNASANLIDTGDGDDTAYGGLGGDTFMTGAGNDTAYGDYGNDTFVDDAGDDIYDGQYGGDWVDFGSSTAGIDADLDNGAVANGADAEDISHIENLLGSAFDDTIVGDGKSNTIRARGGDDDITGSGGDDHLFGGAGSDLARGGNGDDDLYGRGGPDFLYGGAGTDLANGGPGADVCKAEIKHKC
jgi:Ca2+-binding RTX toxin-like protein